MWDDTTDTILASRDVLRKEFVTAGVFQDFLLDFYSYPDHVLEFRTYWWDTAYIRQDKVTVTAPTPAYVWEAETQLSHLTGASIAGGWAANTDYTANFLAYGPNPQPHTQLPVGQRMATFRLMIDDNTSNNVVVARVDIYNATTGQTVWYDITRGMFGKIFTYQDFSIPFIYAQGHLIDMRVYWYDTSFIGMDKVVVR